MVLRNIKCCVIFRPSLARRGKILLMQLSNASKVCNKINENVAYTFLFRNPVLELDEQIEVFVEDFAENHNLTATTIAPQKWVFSHKDLGLLEDGVVELEAETSVPRFKFNDVSKAKITENSPDIPRDLENAAYRFKDMHSEYLDKVKSSLSALNNAIKNFSSLASSREEGDSTSIDVNKELSELQKNYHLMLDKVFEVQNASEKVSDKHSSRVENSLKSLNSNIERINTNLDHIEIQ